MSACRCALLCKSSSRLPENVRTNVATKLMACGVNISANSGVIGPLISIPFGKPAWSVMQVCSFPYFIVTIQVSWPPAVAHLFLVVLVLLPPAAKPAPPKRDEPPQVANSPKQLLSLITSPSLYD